MITQHDLAIHAMFVKAENAAKRRLPKGRPWVRNTDNTYAYKAEKDRVGAPYKVFRDLSWYVR